MKYYWRAVVLPAVFILCGTAVFGIIYATFDLSADYRSEWMSADSFLAPTIILTGIHGFFVCIISSGIFLHTYPMVKNKLALSLLSWFLLPFTWLGILLSLLFLSLTERPYDLEFIIRLLSNTTPYLFCLMVQYSNYRRDEKRLSGLSTITNERDSSR